MHRIDGPGATANNRFTDGDPVSGVPATMVTDDWANDIQEELMSILAARGITPVKGTTNQVLTAINGLISASITPPPPDASITVKGIARIATQTEVDNANGVDLIVTPVTMGKKFTDYFKQATTSVLGVAKIATQALVNAGVDAITFVTPATLRFGVAYSLTLQGYIIFPSWLGGFAVQWGSVASAGAVTFPTAFSAAYIAMAGSNVAGNFASTTTLTTTSILLQNSGNQAMTWFAIGRI